MEKHEENDQWMRNKLEGLDEVPIPAWNAAPAWDRIESELHPKRKRAVIWWWTGAAASVLVLLSVGLWQLNSSADDEQQPLAKKTEQKVEQDQQPELAETQPKIVLEDTETAVLPSNPTAVGQNPDVQASKTTAQEPEFAEATNGAPKESDPVLPKTTTPNPITPEPQIASQDVPQTPPAQTQDDQLPVPDPIEDEPEPVIAQVEDPVVESEIDQPDADVQLASATSVQTLNKPLWASASPSTPKKKRFSLRVKVPTPKPVQKELADRPALAVKTYL